MPVILALRAVRASATATSQPPDVWGVAFSQFAGYGVVGITCVILGIVVWRMWVKDQKDAQQALDREIVRTGQERERADRAEQMNLDLNREVREKVVPLLTEVARVTADQLAQNRNRDR